MKTLLTIKKTIPILYCLTLLISSCSKDDPDAINEQEYISNVVITLDSSDSESQIVDWDLSEMNTQNINLKLNTNYNVNVSFLNNSDPSDVENITLEIIEEADEHQVFFEFADVNVNVTLPLPATQPMGTRYDRFF